MTYSACTLDKRHFTGWLADPVAGGIGCHTISFFYHLRKVRFYSDGSSSASVLPCHLQSHFHIHTHVRGTHVARLWVGREYPILLARTCHQRISLSHDIMALLLLQHRAFDEPPLTLCSTTWQHPSPAHNLPGRFLPTLFPCTVLVQGFMLAQTRQLHASTCQDNPKEQIRQE